MSYQLKIFCKAFIAHSLGILTAVWIAYSFLGSWFYAWVGSVFTMTENDAVLFLLLGVALFWGYDVRRLWLRIAADKQAFDQSLGSAQQR